jgi:hypothetical protein
MRFFSWCAYGAAFAALSLICAGCGYSGAPDANASGTHAGAEAPAPDVSHDELLYVTDAHDDYVYMISLPSGKLVGKLTGFNQPAGDCVDAAGDVFIVDSHHSEIREYKHGAKSAFNVLNDHPYVPVGCSVDRMTGNLAVANCCGETQMGSVALYTDARGKAKYYEDSSVEIYSYCAYDARGDLFVDGISRTKAQFILLEIPSRRDGFTTITLKPRIPGDVSPPLFWDGSDLAIASPHSGAIDRFEVTGNTASRVHVTKLGSANGIYGSFWITADGATRTLYAPIVENSVASVGVYRYPQGGKPIADFYDVVSPFGATVSPHSN